MSHPALTAAVAALHAEGRLRVWSLVVTVFGDAVDPRGGRIATARLQALLARIGVEPGALRTALSRLATDGWLERERTGRVSSYRLGPRGIAETRPAAARIYAAPAADPETWTLGLGPAPADAVTLGGEAWIAPGRQRAGHLAVTGTIAALGAEGFGRTCPPDAAGALAAVRAEALALEAAAPRLAPPEAMAARIVLIHRWRRAVLRGHDRPAALLPPRLADPAPRAAVAAAYAALRPRSEAWLDAAEAGLAPMPPASAGLANRFGMSSGNER
ncbi:MAG: hypothetical protein NXH83_06280 [Rhodobacteraceae bacterium]|nr:hypothetical protein [Paracoccaceae bacterium]